MSNAEPPRGHLFTTAAFLTPLAASAQADTGWIALTDVATAAPCWQKHHSWGEFVFDHRFAQAYAQHGLDYYPKLVCALPFTPVPGPRLGLQPARAAQNLLQQCAAQACSSVHVLFADSEEVAALDSPEWLLRQDIRYVWRNRDYTDFEAFLAALTSKRRKTLRTERRQVAAYGMTLQWQPGDAFSPDQWDRLYALYASTYHMRGQHPYLHPDTLRGWAAALGPQMQICTATLHDEIVAMAFFFRDATHLYGRHWGAARDWPGLHFELCYYQGIDYAIREGLQLFDAGVQGQHRLLRGFEPEVSQSLHHFRDPRFAGAIGNYLEQERQAVTAEWAAQRAHTAFRNLAA
ncbi:MAG: GNAT family N-acetyltransferase [Oceanococcaceae bacterium]